MHTQAHIQDGQHAWPMPTCTHAAAPTCDNPTLACHTLIHYIQTVMSEGVLCLTETGDSEQLPNRST